VRKIFFLLSFLALLVGSRTWAETADLKDYSTSDFSKTAMAHLRHLADLGVREAGSKQERRAIEYVGREFKRAGLQVSIEPFEFASYQVKRATLSLGKRQLTPTFVIFNPYQKRDALVAEAVWAKPVSEGGLQNLDGAGKILLTDSRDGYWCLMGMRPLAIVCVAAKDAEMVQKLSGSQARLEVKGEYARVHSANVVACLRPERPQRKEILLSAHLDSIGGPGANDNASGVAVLLTLAEYFAQHRTALSSPIRFIAFGAEESGMSGSRAFVERHTNELANCQLLCNLDVIGGKGEIMMDLPARAEDPTPPSQHQLPSRFRRRQLIGEKWMLLEPTIFSLNYFAPAWLRDAVSLCSKETGIPVQAINYSGSDHMSFASTGLPITSVVVVQPGGTKEHTSEDSVARICPDTLAKVGRLVATLTMKVISLPVADSKQVN
jgi:hypothetical protein